MKKLKTFTDERLIVNFCIFCGGKSSTSDHVPSKILLDEPYPDDLPVAPACRECNESFAMDEEYIASILECAIQGSVDSEKMRLKIKKTLEKKPSLKKEIAKKNITGVSGNSVWEFDINRLENLLFKLGSGHAYYELELATLGKPDHIGCMPLSMMRSDQLMRFESSVSPILLPEIGTRLFQRILENSTNIWQVVQLNRYRYCVIQSGCIWVKMVLSEYLAAEVIWIEKA